MRERLYGALSLSELPRMSRGKGERESGKDDRSRAGSSNTSRANAEIQTTAADTQSTGGEVPFCLWCGGYIDLSECYSVIRCVPKISVWTSSGNRRSMNFGGFGYMLDLAIKIVTE